MRRRHRARHRETAVPQSPPPRRRVPGSAAPARLDHDDRLGQPGHQPISGQEPVPRGRGPRRVLADHRTVAGDLCCSPPVAGRIVRGRRHTPAPRRSARPRRAPPDAPRIDPECRAGHDRPAVGREVTDDLGVTSPRRSWPARVPTTATTAPPTRRPTCPPRTHSATVHRPSATGPQRVEGEQSPARPLVRRPGSRVALPSPQQVQVAGGGVEMRPRRTSPPSRKLDRSLSSTARAASTGPTAAASCASGGHAPCNHLRQIAQAASADRAPSRGASIPEFERRRA